MPFNCSFFEDAASFDLLHVVYRFPSACQKGWWVIQAEILKHAVVESLSNAAKFCIASYNKVCLCSCTLVLVTPPALQGKVITSKLTNPDFADRSRNNA